ncbi:MAG: hypothetical protein J7J30_03775 [Candidatus Odinarchaeota archaeon]|nr:hypothetical protein [Candidatus Odinarchaeota archaeon]
MSELSRFKIKFVFGGKKEILGELIRIKAPRTIEKLLLKLPITSRVMLWPPQNPGEIYFNVGIKMGKEKARKDIEPGDIAYWPMGDALCIFYEKIEPYSEVNVVGRIISDLNELREVKRGEIVKVLRVE